ISFVANVLSLSLSSPLPPDLSANVVVALIAASAATAAIETILLCVMGSSLSCLRRNANSRCGGLFRLRRSKDPERLPRHLEPMRAGCQRLIAVRTHTRLADMEHVLPLVAKVHRRRKFRREAVVARTFRDANALESNHADTVAARRGAGLRGSPQAPAVAFEQR